MSMWNFHFPSVSVKPCIRQDVQGLQEEKVVRKFLSLVDVFSLIWLGWCVFESLVCEIRTLRWQLKMPIRRMRLNKTVPYATYIHLNGVVNYKSNILADEYSIYGSSDPQMPQEQRDTNKSEQLEQQEPITDSKYLTQLMRACYSSKLS